MSKIKINPSFFVWYPVGLSTGVGPSDLSWIYVVLAGLAFWFIFERLCAKHR